MCIERRQIWCYTPNYIYAFFMVCSTNQRELEDIGKTLKGKELGKGIRQREDVLYQARFYK